MVTAEKLESQETLVEAAFKPFEVFCRAMLDGYCVVDETGRIVKLNQMLCQLTGMKSKQLLKASSLEEVIHFEINGNKLNIRDIINQSAPTRIDEVRGKPLNSAVENPSLNLILGVYPFSSDGTPIGAFILIRDVTAETNLQGKYKDAANKSISDPLTGLFTRGYFEDYLRLQTKTLNDIPADSEQRMISLIMADIDHFKKVNDVHGHPAGDHIIKTVAAVMKRTFRKADVVCRYGGEEFLIILPSTDLHGTAAAAEKLRANIESEKIVFEGVTIPITISLGVAQINVGTETYNETIVRADGALYESKRAGRNRVTVAE